MILCLLTLAVAQQSLPPITASAKAQAISELSKALIENYVFPDIAKKATDDLKSKIAGHAYDSDEDGQAFAKHINSDLKAICHDAHLHLRYSVDSLPERQQAAEPSPAEIKQEEAQTRRNNAGIEHVERLNGNVGYLEVRAFEDTKAAERPIQAAFDFLANCDSLILDLRRNGGGEADTVDLLCSYLFGKTPVHLNDIYFRDGNQTKEFWTRKNLRGHRFENKPVYVLVSRRTGSGAEECAYDLQNTHRATIIGESTWGGANPGGFFRLDDHFNAFIPVGRAINPYTHANWEGTGVTPDVKTEPSTSLSFAEHLAVSKMLEAASDADDIKRLKSVLEELDQESKSAVTDRK